MKQRKLTVTLGNSIWGNAFNISRMFNFAINCQSVVAKSFTADVQVITPNSYFLTVSVHGDTDHELITRDAHVERQPASKCSSPATFQSATLTNHPSLILNSGSCTQRDLIKTSFLMMPPFYMKGQLRITSLALIKRYCWKG